MSEREFFLASSTRAFIGSEDAVHLVEQKERIEQAVVSGDPALTLDTAKAFLESLFKTILSDRLDEPNLVQDMNPLYRNVRDILPLNRERNANEILKHLTSCIVHNVAELRNSYGAASHGDDGYYENPVEMPEAEMVANIVDGMAGFLFKKHKSHGNPELAARIYYNDHPEFNNYLDGQYEGYKLALGEDKAIELSPSELLFSADEDAYREMLLQYLSTEEIDQELGRHEVEVAEPTEELPPEEPIIREPVSNEQGINEFIQVMLFNDEARMSVTEDEIRQVAEFAVDYAKNQAGLDWQTREPLRAKFRTLLRRQLTKVTFTETFLDQAIEAAIDKAVELYPSNIETID